MVNGEKKNLFELLFIKNRNKLLLKNTVKTLLLPE